MVGVSGAHEEQVQVAQHATEPSLVGGRLEQIGTWRNGLIDVRFDLSEDFRWSQHAPSMEGIDNACRHSWCFRSDEEVCRRGDAPCGKTDSISDGFVDQRQGNRQAAPGFEHSRKITERRIVGIFDRCAEATLIEEDRMKMCLTCAGVDGLYSFEHGHGDVVELLLDGFDADVVAEFMHGNRDRGGHERGGGVQ